MHIQSTTRLDVRVLVVSLFVVMQPLMLPFIRVRDVRVSVCV